MFNFNWSTDNALCVRSNDSKGIDDCMKTRKDVINLDEKGTVFREHMVEPAPKVEEAKVTLPLKHNGELGARVAESALDFESTIAEYLHTQCVTIEKLLCSGQEDLIVTMLNSFKENLEQVCDIEKHLLYKLDEKLGINP